MKVMKKYILLLGILIVSLSAQAQALILVNGDTIKFENELTITQSIYYNELNFSTGNQRYTFDIREIECLDFAATYTGIESISENETIIAYNAEEEKVIVINGSNDGEITLFDGKGTVVKSARGSETSVGDLAPGLYIVSYNRKINAKILKK